MILTSDECCDKHIDKGCQQHAGEALNTRWEEVGREGALGMPLGRGAA